MPVSSLSSEQNENLLKIFADVMNSPENAVEKLEGIKAEVEILLGVARHMLRTSSSSAIVETKTINTKDVASVATQPLHASVSRNSSTPVFVTTDKRSLSVRREYLILAALSVPDTVEVGVSTVFDVLQKADKKYEMGRASLTTKLNRLKSFGLVKWRNSSSMEVTDLGRAEMRRLGDEALKTAEKSALDQAVAEVMSAYRK